MIAPSFPTNDSTLVQRSLEALKELRLRYEALQQSRQEPIAIVGIGCRLPGGVDSPESLWQLLSTQKDAITEIPPGRFGKPAEPGGDGKPTGGSPLRFGGLLRDLDRFDPYFFGISPREAAKMDPQQRLFLEVAWHALEDAGLRAEDLAGSDTGVFVGANSADYLQLQLAEPALLDNYSLIGGVSCIIANRLSYLLDLHGPSMVLDTACSSSLVAIHLACQSLRTAECAIAIVGGMNLLLSAPVAQAHVKGLPLAEDGRCKTFDARADGYVRGEGCGVVVLKRLRDALASGDHIWAVVRGTAVNQDGLSNGLTAPNGRAQRAVIGKALAVARVDPAEVGLVETHGTGTVLGDPIEVECLRDIYGALTPGCTPCALGSIKTNIGHLEAAAGIAGLIKASLALQYGQIPANLHFQSLNPHLSLDDSRLIIPTALQDFPGPVGKRHAAVSSFGAGGTNAHVVLAEPPAAAAEAESLADDTGAPQQLLPLSARSHEALARLAQKLAQFLATGPGAHTSLGTVCRAAALRRSHHPHRLAIVASSHQDAIAQLLAAANPQVAPPADRCTTLPQLAFVCTQSLPTLQSIRDCCRNYPVFRAAFERCEQAVEATNGPALRHILWSPQPTAELPSGLTAHTLLFAVQVALAETWRAWGIMPLAMMGYGLGEIAAAYLSGALSLTDALRTILTQGHAPISGLQPSLPFYSTALAGCVTRGALNYERWTAALGQTVAVDAVGAQLVKDGHSALIELGGESRFLTGASARWASECSDAVLSVSSLTTTAAADSLMLPAAAALYVAGARFHFPALYSGQQRFIRLPLYPFQREAFWFKLRDTAESFGAPPRTAEVDGTDSIAPTRRPNSGGSLQELVHGEVANLLRFDPLRLDPRQGFFQLGMDSVMAAQLRNRLEQRLDRKYPVSVIFEHPSVHALAGYLEQALTPLREPQLTQDRASSRRADARDLIVDGSEDIATLLLNELNETAVGERLQ